MFGLTENDRGLLRGLDTEHLNPVVVHPPQRASRGIHHTRRGRACEALLPGLFARHLWGPQGNVALARSVSCLPFHAEVGLVLEPRQELQQSGQTDCVPLSPVSPDTCMIALICPDSIQPGVPLDFKCRTSVIQRLPRAEQLNREINLHRTVCEYATKSVWIFFFLQNLYWIYDRYALTVNQNINKIATGPSAISKSNEFEEKDQMHHNISL